MTISLVSVQLQRLTQRRINRKRIQKRLGLIVVLQFAAGERNGKTGPKGLQSPQRRVVFVRRLYSATIKLEALTKQI